MTVLAMATLLADAEPTIRLQASEQFLDFGGHVARIVPGITLNGGRERRNQFVVSGSCPSARGFAPRFLPTLGHPHAVAFRFVRRGQLTVGLPPSRSRPCWAHIGSDRGFARSNLGR